jgi:glycosyltransferase involved in cell wall biosynthesis
MNTPLLSICIPTYNGLRHLRTLVPALLAEVTAANRDGLRVELLISDNASPDGTGAFVQSLAQPGLVYHGNPVNIGGDPNFLLCVERAHGQYVWLFGDDDLFTPGSILRVLRALEQHHPALLILPADSPAGSDPEPVIHATYSDFLRQGGVSSALGHTLITCNVFLREKFRFDRATAMRRTCYGHMFGLVDGLPPDAPVAELADVVHLPPPDQNLARRKHWPVFLCLCVKQAIYLWHLANVFHVRAFHWPAVRIACHLPVEIAAWSARRILAKMQRR